MAEHHNKAILIYQCIFNVTSWRQIMKRDGICFKKNDQYHKNDERFAFV